MRVVSLLLSASEIVCALGGGGELVGVSHECDHPPEVAGREVRVVSLHPRRLGDIWDDVRRVADAIGREAAGEALVRDHLDRDREAVRRVDAGLEVHSVLP